MKKLCILLIALALLLCVSAQAETRTVSGVPSAEALRDVGDPAAGYIHDLMYQTVRRGDTAAVHLEGSARKLYDFLRPLVIKVGEGKRSSTVFEPDCAAIYGDAPFATSEEAFTQEFDDVNDVINALLLDLPYDLYWFDKTSGWSCSGGIQDCGGGLIPEGVRISMAVARTYQDGDRLVFNTKYGKRARKAANNAAAIVSAHAGEDDRAKMQSYKDEICGLVSYNFEAASGGVAYGDPWQMVWVFDGDAGTNVVCEGYSKAFQYLCDRSDFRSKKTKAVSVTGMMRVGYGGGGRHMWNVVTLGDGLHYLVDVTNCDSGMIGAPNALFLAGYVSGDYKGGYTYGPGITYVYEQDEPYLFNLMGVDNLLMVNAGGEQPEKAPAINATVNGVKYKLSGAAATVTGAGSKSAEKVVIPSSVTYKGNTYKVTAVKARAFKGLKKLANVVIGKNVKDIGKSAFASCGALKTITIKTTKLTTKTVGANAFKGVNKKATVKVPAKKLKAYKSLLVKKGLPKTAKVKK